MFTTSDNAARGTPYRLKFLPEAVAEIERGSGVIYDAQVADACLKLFREQGGALLA